MGNFFTKNEPQVKPVTKPIPEPITEPITASIPKPRYEPSENDIRQIITKYEHIKNTKHINDMNKLIDVIQNTDWDKIIIPTHLPEASAPIIQEDMHIPIAVARIIEPNELIK